MRCLMMPAPKPFFCCIFPSFDPIVPPQIVVRDDTRPSSFQILPRTLQGCVMTETIADQFAKLARDLQKQLLVLLDSTDCHKHLSMVKEASFTFAAFEQLQIGYQPIHERVEEFIRSASVLSEIEDSVRNDRYANELQEHYNCKKRRFDAISRDYDEAKAKLETSRERFCSLIEEASHFRELLFHVEAELSCCATEKQYHEKRCSQISEDWMKAKQDFEVAFEAADEALKLLQQKKEERNAAEAACKKARIQLRLLM